MSDARTEGHYCLTCGSYQCEHAHATYAVTPAELGRALAAVAPPIGDAQALEAARILASNPGDNR